MNTNTIVQKAKSGDSEAIAELYSSSIQSVYYICLKLLKNQHDAEDIAADTMVSVLENLKELKEDNAYVAWVNRIAINKCKNFLAKNKPMLLSDDEETIIDETELNDMNEEFLPEEYIISKEKRELLMDVIKEKTTKAELMTILSYYYNGDSIKTIAENMNCAEITVKTRLAKARKKIKEGIESKLGKDALFVGTVGLYILQKAIKAEAAETAVPAVIAAVPSAISPSVPVSNMAGSPNNAGNPVPAKTTSGAGTSIDLGEPINSLPSKTGLSKLAIGGIIGGAAAAIAVIIGIILFVTGDDNHARNNHNNIAESAKKTSFYEDMTPASSETATPTPETEQATIELMDFERKHSTDLGYTAPSVHTEANEECKFFWDITEESFINWFAETAASTDGIPYNTVENHTSDYDLDYRKILYSTGGSYNVAGYYITSSGYSSKYLSEICLHLQKWRDFEEMKALADAFIDYVGLGNYKEEIIHTEIIDIPTENGLGKYQISTVYHQDEITGEFSLEIKIQYFDTHFRDTVFNIKPDTMETWETDHQLRDYLKNTSLDNSSIVNFTNELYNYLLTNVNSTIRNPKTRHEYSYTINPETGAKEDIDSLDITTYDYDTSENGAPETGGINISDEISMGIHYIIVSVDANPKFGHTVFNERDMTEDDVNALCEKRLAVAKLLDKNLPYTAADIRKSFEHFERDGEDDIEPYRNDNFEYTVVNSEDNLFFYIQDLNETD